jgi:hypothetical protein
VKKIGLRLFSAIPGEAGIRHFQGLTTFLDPRFSPGGRPKNNFFTASLFLREKSGIHCADQARQSSPPFEKGRTGGISEKGLSDINNPKIQCKS